MREIETSKGRFVVMEASDWGLTKKQLYELEFPIVEKIGFIHNITEKQASSVVDLYEFQHNPTKTLYNLHEIGIRKWTTSAIQSLHSLLESQGIEITNNTYIFKV